MAVTGIFTVLALLSLSVVANGDSCLSPTVSSEIYTTPESIVSTETVFIVEFSVNCKNGLKSTVHENAHIVKSCAVADFVINQFLTNINLYTEFGGKTVPATKIGETNKFQMSFSDAHKKLPSGNYQIRVFDEEGYALLRKVQRSGENTDSIKPLFTLDLNHPGVWNGPIFQSEFVAAIIAICVWWSAYTAKNRLQQ